jgi:hypothetical protein
VSFKTTPFYDSVSFFFVKKEMNLGNNKKWIIIVAPSLQCLQSKDFM